MARRIKAKLIMKLLAAGLSHNAIAKSQKVSKRSVGEVAHAARDVGLDWETASGMTDAEVYAALFPGRGEAEPAYDVPDWAEVHRELAKNGVTLKLTDTSDDGNYLFGPARRSRDRRARRGVPVRGLPALLQVRLRGGLPGHARGHLAAVPRARLLLLRRLHANHSA